MNTIDNLVNTLLKLPGIGKRQAKRFAYALTKEHGKLGQELGNILKNIQKEVFTCVLCGSVSVGIDEYCENCNNSRNARVLALVANQEDYETLVQLEKYRGNIAIVPFPYKIELADKTNTIENSYIAKTIEYWKQKGLEEIILAFPITPEGSIMENLITEYIEKINQESEEKHILITALGRGMSLGSRMADSDNETVGFALETRKRLL